MPSQAAVPCADSLQSSSASGCTWLFQTQSVRTAHACHCHDRASAQTSSRALRRAVDRSAAPTCGLACACSALEGVGAHGRCTQPIAARLLRRRSLPPRHTRPVRSAALGPFGSSPKPPESRLDCGGLLCSTRLLPLHALGRSCAGLLRPADHGNRRGPLEHCDPTQPDRLLNTRRVTRTEAKQLRHAA